MNQNTKEKDSLGTRIKEQYENRTRYMLPRRTYTLLRIDGKSFHTYTRGLRKPFDKELFDDMDAAIIAMMPQIQGAAFAYTQSDEISVLLTDFAKPTTSAWFDGNLQKVSSVATSIITAEFNRLRLKMERQGSIHVHPMAYFDCRAFTIPDRIEVMNYFIWRNQDCIRNSISMAAQSLFSHKELQGQSTENMLKMIGQKSVDWQLAYSAGERNGRVIVKEYNYRPMEGHLAKETMGIPRANWVSIPAWKFTEDMNALKAMIPTYE